VIYGDSLVPVKETYLVVANIALTEASMKANTKISCFVFMADFIS